MILLTEDLEQISGMIRRCYLEMEAPRGGSKFGIMFLAQKGVAEGLHFSRRDNQGPKKRG